MSASLMLRSAINTAATAARYSRHSTFPKSSLSTLSFPTSTLDHEHQGAGESRGALMDAAAPALSASYHKITSHVTNILANVSGDWTLTTVNTALAQLEKEEGAWEDLAWEDLATTAIEAPGVGSLAELSLWQISTLKRRKKKMNKHKLRKRRKKMRLKTRRQ